MSDLGPQFEQMIEQTIGQLLDQSGARANRDLLREIMREAIRLAHQDMTRLDLKIVSAALSEMADAFRMFAPFRAVPKITVFGSARTLPSDALYEQAFDLARRMSEAGWMVVTGAGPGIMAAAAEGAGRAMSIGVNIRLPFEQSPNASLASDPKLVEMRYFFTRKLMLMKESSGFAVLPGGFGTLDEVFELLTLVQTGKAEPTPIVLLDRPGDTYWKTWQHFITSEVITRGYASADDPFLFLVTDNVEVTMEEIVGFYRNYHSRRFVGETMVVRLRVGVSDSELGRLNEEFADIAPNGIRRTEPLPPERSGRDHLGLPRLAMEFDRLHHGRLRQFINALNRCEGDGQPARDQSEKPGATERVEEPEDGSRSRGGVAGTIA